ncbi:PREDICTED: diphthamide biosynthesis protein 2 [Prunus mume]|uniref:2-(3-amino-3-carboxypropyl)histidine synthase subunit 2 n=1 Tax=Prunus mume TaxID=102107 RepID=A0ABM0NF01_PRUMU|nr:PREDICTED: diphthamide biosynthesis protein 2 [Prunus mume]
MDLESNYEIAPTAEFIQSNKFTRVALQFPDELLKDAVRVVSALRAKLRTLRESNAEQNDDAPEVGLFVMADTAYGSCCVDEVGASHVDADAVVHYGHTCLSPTSTLPAFFVFGKTPISVPDCVKNLSHYAFPNGRRVLVLFGLDYAHSIQNIREKFAEVCGAESKPEVQYANVICSVMNPSKGRKVSNKVQGTSGSLTDNNSFGTVSANTYSIGGLVWKLPEGHKMDDYLLFWIGSNNSAFANIVLTYNGCEIVRYDASECSMVTDLSQQRKILKRRYYLMEKAKDANIVGILVGTLGVAGYLNMIHQMKVLITGAGKKVYTLVMGRPNPAKLANFPECDIFIYVSCAQTALLDSKEYLAPVITPFEAMLAFNRGCQWTGEYVMEFRDLINSSPVESRNFSEEARFSFLQGGYVEDFDPQGNGTEEDKEGALALANATEKVLQLRDNPNSIVKGTAKSGAEFLATRSYQGLDIHYDGSLPEPYFIGRSGRAAGYEDEKNGHEKS